MSMATKEQIKALQQAKRRVDALTRALAETAGDTGAQAAIAERLVDATRELLAERAQIAILTALEIS